MQHILKVPFGLRRCISAPPTLNSYQMQHPTGAMCTLATTRSLSVIYYCWYPADDIYLMMYCWKPIPFLNLLFGACSRFKLLCLWLNWPVSWTRNFVVYRTGIPYTVSSLIHKLKNLSLDTWHLYPRQYISFYQFDGLLQYMFHIG